MKLVIDNINTLTGWSASGGASIYALNSIGNFIAGNNSASLIAKFVGIGSSIEKTYSINVSNYTELTLHLYSNTLGDDNQRKIGDFQYKIDFGSGDEFYLKVGKNFESVTFDISSISTITKIKVTALHANTDYLFLSYAVASYDEFPLDIYSAIKEQIEFLIDNEYTLKQVGTVTATTGASSIQFASRPNYIDRYSAIKIDDGVNSEIHLITRIDDDTYYFGGLFDGATIQNDYTNAPVYLYYPVIFGTTQKEIVLPSITYWGFAPEKEIVSSEFDKVIDTINVANETYEERNVGQYLNWPILIDCEDKDSYGILGIISEIVRKFVGKRVIWVNGRKVNIEFVGASTELMPTDAYDIIPKIQYPVQVQIREEIYNRITLPKLSTLDVDVNILED